MIKEVAGVKCIGLMVPFIKVIGLMVYSMERVL